MLPLQCQIKTAFIYHYFIIMKFSEFYKILEKNGWKRSEGKKHAIYTHPGVDYFIPVGRHPSKEIPIGTLNKMMKDAGLK